MVLNNNKLGDFREIVGFCNNNAIPKGAGREDVYSTFYSCRGKLDKESGGRGLQFAEISGSDRYTLRVRYRQTLWDSLKTNMKVIISNEFYTIDSFEKEGNIEHFIKLKINKKVDA